MNKVSPVKLKKSPWIPPPGKSWHRDKIPAKTTKDASCLEMNESRTPAKKPAKNVVRFSIDLKQSVAATTVTPCDTTEDGKEMAGDIMDVDSVSSVSSLGQVPNDKDIHLHSIKEEMKLLAIHFRSLKRLSLFLTRHFSTYGIDDLTIQDLMSKIDDSVKDIIYELDDLEYSITLVENTIEQATKTEEYWKVIKVKENLLSKLLDGYSKAVVIFETIIQKHNAENLTRIEKDQEFIQKQLQNYEKKCATQSSVIKDFERRLSILQGKTNTVESYKSTLEDTRTELQKQLSYKEAQIKYLNTELSKHLSDRRSTVDNEKLLKVIEEVQKNALAEKRALKKALKVQKLHSEKAKESVERLERDLKEKEKMIFSLAGQRDQLKLQLTLAKNSLIEGKNQAEERKSQIAKLQDELYEKESSFKRQHREILDSLNEKTTQLNDAVQVKLKLQKDIEDTWNKLETTGKELKALKASCSDIDVLLSKSHGDGNNVNALEDVRHLITLLQDTKDYFKNDKTSAHSATIEGENVTNVNKTDNTHMILTAVEEIKRHLLELKNICDVCPTKQNGETGQEMKFKELQQLYSECSKENKSLKSEIEELKASRFPSVQTPANENSPSYMPGKDWSINNLQMELKLKTEENWRIKQSEKDLVRQLAEVKDKLQKKEIENFKLFSIEEELKSRRNELSILERKKEEESEKSQRKIKELQESLDRITTDYESLKRYVQVLKSSYLNVFGDRDIHL